MVKRYWHPDWGKHQPAKPQSHTITAFMANERRKAELGSSEPKPSGPPDLKP